MSSTPRVPTGAFPQTPATAARAPPTPSPTPSPAPPSSSPLPLAPQNAPRTGQHAPLIPLRILDAPTQRFYAAGLYAALLAWRLYDWVQLVEDNTESFWLFLKWIAIDFVFLFGLPELRIPWLELSQPFVVVAFFAHVALNFMLMFNIGLPWQAWLLGVLRVFYDREVAISEHNVKLSSILHNSSLIMGRQVVNILPEGSAVLNPEGAPFCLGGDRKTASLPIQFNATVPADVEIVRVHLDTNRQEVLKLSRSQLREIERRTKGQATADGIHSVVQFDFPVKKPGAYRLGKVLDEYKLEVQRRTPHTFVVPCPEARFQPTTAPGRCLGDLSDLSLQVDGTPPLKIVYSRTVNGRDHSFHFQSLQPDGFASPLLNPVHSTNAIAADGEDLSWARSQRVTVGLNESMHTGGDWQYGVDEVHDAFGNVAKLAPAEDSDLVRPRPKHLAQTFVVKERPRARLEGCDLRHPLKVARGGTTELPIAFSLAHDKRTPDDTSHSLAWLFSPIDTLTASGDHGEVVTTGSHSAKNVRDHPKISAPGLYTLKSVAAGACDGEIEEPASCLLLNPLEPKLTLRSEDITDACAGNAIGLRVSLDLIGTPPFVVRYDVSSNGDVRSERVEVNAMRTQLELVPRVAGSHRYRFTQIDDAIYKGQPLRGADYVLEQDVKPAASALVQKSATATSLCLGDDLATSVLLLGEPPFTLEWELVHDGKRKRHQATDIDDHHFAIRSGPLDRGGEYALSLTSVQDRRACRNFLQDGVKVSVRRQRPRVAFGLLEGRRSLRVIEDAAIHLPLRLTGEGPWHVAYRNRDLGGDDAPVFNRTLHHDNDVLDVRQQGVYEIVDVYDHQCHGTVDLKANTFAVDWFPRPEIALVPAPSVAEQPGKAVKQDVCEGDIDGFEISLKGSPPYHVEYEVRHAPPSGTGSLHRKSFDAAFGKASVQMDTARAGLYTYQFSSLADNLYNSDKRSQPLVLEQRVNARPSASFAKPGQSFKYCLAEADDEEPIPLTLAGVPPFYVEIEVRHQSGSAPETYRIPSIESISYSLHIPRRHLRLGSQQVRIRKVRDARGCQHEAQGTANGPSVQVQMYDAPAIYPLETRADYCVGERISYSLSGTPPFDVWYTFDGAQRRARSPTTNFRRIAESAGEFAIDGVADRASECRAAVHIPKTIHPMPAVKVSRGRNARVDIHEGGEVDILFEFWGSPPFEFTYTRSTNERRGQRSQVLETRHDTSWEHAKVVRTSQEGTYEVVAIKDKYCAFSTQQVDKKA